MDMFWIIVVILIITIIIYYSSMNIEGMDAVLTKNVVLTVDQNGKTYYPLSIT